MQPRIHYAKTSDGVSIAYWTLGEGPPLVYIPAIPWSHIQLEWQQIPPLRRAYELHARGRWLIGYDARGTGSSDRDVSDFSLDAHLRDLEAVLERLQLERFDLMARGYGVNMAVAYAVRNPDRVTRLVLTTPRPGVLEESHDSSLAHVFRALREAVRHSGDFRILTETVAHEILGWEAGDDASRLAAFFRECTSHEAALAIYNAFDACDLTDLLPHVRSPTLVIGFPNPWYPPLEAARWVASRIPDARLVVVDRTPGVPALEDTQMLERIHAAIDEFLGEGQAAAPAAAELQPPGTLRTVLFTDLVGHTEMMSRLGDERGRDVLREHERITREVLKAHGGTEVKTMGDGFMASFGSVARSVECAIALQKAFDDRNRAVGAQGLAPLRVRCGLNAGEPIEEDGDLFGATVILASRIAASAEAGEILVADTVRGLCSGKGFHFSDRGGLIAKGFEEPVRVYEVRWQE